MIKLKSILLFNNRLVVYAVLILLANIFFYTLPLVGIFGYEFSIVNGFLFYLLSGVFTISLLKNNSIVHDFSKIKQSLIIFAVVIILIPFIIINIKTVLGAGCSFTSGLYFYLVISFPSLVVGIVSGTIAYFFVKRFHYVVLVFITLLILSLPVYEIYFYPQIYFYNPIVAYYPGTIFDEGMSVSLKLLIYRSLNILFFGFIGWSIIRSVKVNYRGMKAFILSIIFIPSITFFFISPSLGFSTDEARIKKHLNKSVFTNHFVINYDESIEKQKIEVLALYHEYCYQQLRNYLQTIPSKKINTFIFKDDKQKKELFGSSNADVAKPWLYHAYLSYDSYTNTLQHELAHCFSAEFGSGIFKLADWFNPSLIEGIASASDPYYDDNFITYMAALAYKNGYKINLRSLFKNLNFFGQSASISYIYSGAFSFYLIEKYGIQKFKQLYTNSDFEKIYQLSFEEIEKSFFAHLDELSTDNKNRADYYFGRKSIIYKTCPRYISSRLDDAWAYYNQNDIETAQKIFNEVMTYGDNYSAMIGLSHIFGNKKEYNNAIALFDTNITKFSGTSFYFHLQFRLADVLSLAGDSSKAGSNYKNIYDANPNRTLYYLSAIRLKLLEKNLLKDYLEGSEYDKLSILKSVNNENYFYPAWAVIIELSEKLNESPDRFINEFSKTIFVDSYESSFAVFKLSQYLVRKGEFAKARRMAALALRYKDDRNFSLVLKENFRMISWLSSNSQIYLNNFIFD